MSHGGEGVVCGNIAFMPDGMSRRGFLRVAGATGLFAFVSWDGLEAALAQAPKAGQPGRFLTGPELDTLRAVTGRLVPGPPEDPRPGAIEARCAEAIDALLGAFTFDPPLIHAGGPYSNRAGSTTDDFARFVPLDAQAELGWRIRLEGSQGKPERSFAGPVVGWQALYRRGLASVDRLARPAYRGFAAASTARQDAILQTSSETDFVQLVLGHTLDAFFGPPEYHGNTEQVGWKLVGWPGDVQPRGYTDHQVTTIDPGPALKIDVEAMRAQLPRLLPGVQLTGS